MTGQHNAPERVVAARAYAARALELGAFRVRPDRPFTWASGNVMPLYTDNRHVMRDPEGRRRGRAALLAARAEQQIATVRPDFVVGTASAGIVPATLVAEALDTELLYVRAAPKDHGLGRLVEGLADGENLAGRSSLLIEDLISTGGSSARAARALVDLGAEVPLCLALFSYDLPPVADTFAGLVPGCRAVASVTIEDLIAAARDGSYLDAAGVALVESWHADPFEWQYTYGWARREDR